MVSKTNNMAEKKQLTPQQEKSKLLAYNLVKQVSGFIKNECGNEPKGLDIHVFCTEPTLAMTEDNKVVDGWIVQCTINQWGEDADDIPEEDTDIL